MFYEMKINNTDGTVMINLQKIESVREFGESVTITLTSGAEHNVFGEDFFYAMSHAGIEYMKYSTSQEIPTEYPDSDVEDLLVE